METAAQIIQRSVTTIPSDLTLVQVAKLLLDRGISGAPVVDDEKRLIGIISEYQLLALVYDPLLKDAPITRIMTKEVFTVKEDTPLEKIANLFIVQRIRRVPVVDDEGRLLGIISRPDLLRHVVTTNFVYKRSEDQAAANHA